MRVAMLVVVSLLLLCAACLVGTSSRGYAAQSREEISSGISRSHLAGTDELGRDRAVRLSLALLLGLAGAAGASALASGLAVVLGSFSALGPQWLSRGLLYSADLFLTLPWLFLLMLVRSVLPLTLQPLQSGLVTFLLLAVLGTPAFLRINHERTSALVRTDWLLQAQAAGLRRRQLAWQLLPHVRPLLWTQFLLYLPACLIAEANLGALGLGLSEPLPSLGTFVANLQSAALLGSSFLTFLPILVLLLVLVALELVIFGDQI